MSVSLNRLVPLSGLALCLLASGQVQAQEETERAPWSLMLGAGAAETPRYEGSDEYKTRVMPVVRASLRTAAGTFSLGGEGAGQAGLSWTIIDNKQVEAGLILGYDRGRKESASSHLQGLGKVYGTPEAGAFAAYKFGGLRFNLAVIGGTQDNSGSQVKAGVGYRMRVAEKVGINFNTGLTWASSDYMQRYFGVDAVQSANSGLPQYSAKSGIKDVNAGVHLDYAIDRHWMVFSGYNVSYLTGDAADSPVVQRRLQQRLFGGAAYRW